MVQSGSTVNLCAVAEKAVAALRAQRRPLDPTANFLWLRLTANGSVMVFVRDFPANNKIRRHENHITVLCNKPSGDTSYVYVQAGAA